MSKEPIEVNYQSFLEVPSVPFEFNSQHLTNVDNDKREQEELNNELIWLSVLIITILPHDWAINNVEFTE